MKQYQHEKTFTFTPDDAITDRYSFANALYDYAQKNGKEITITKEGLYPEFVMDGVEYVVEAGEGIRYLANKPHIYECHGTQKTKICMVIYYDK